jgi:DNA-binding MarR family transcriptional regulator
MSNSTRTFAAKSKREDSSGGKAVCDMRAGSLTGLARILVSQIHQRRRYWPRVPLGDPHWLMMLELFIAAEEQRLVSVSSLCMAAGVPSTTALRYVRILEDQDVFERTVHPKDRRICHIRLSADARRQMDRYLASVASAFDGIASAVPVCGEPRPLRSAH